MAWPRLLPFRRLLRLRSKFSVIVLANFVCLALVYTFLVESRDQKFERLGHIDPRTYYRVRINLGPLINKTVYMADTFDYGPCEEREAPSLDITEKHRFIQVHPESTETYVFSAFYDPRLTPPAVRVVGLSSGDNSINLAGVKKFCQIWYADQPHRMEVSSAEYQIIPETHDRKYAVSVHVCYLRRHPSHVPYAVSLVTAKCDEPTHVLKVNFYSYTEAPERDFAVCVTPFNMNYDKPREFVNIVESNRILGAAKFTFYNYSVSARVGDAVRTYVADGLADVIPWHVPVPVDVWPEDPQHIPEVHYFAQLGALTDCLYRNMFTSRYVVFTDLDELVVPRKPAHLTWNDMLGDVNTAPNVGSYLFQCVFFRMDAADDAGATSAANKELVDLGLTTLLKTTRENGTFVHYSRSKYMVNPRLVELVGVHFVFEYLDNKEIQTQLVYEDMALLHHYRLWEDEGHQPKHADRTMYKYKRKLIGRARDRTNKILSTNNKL